MTDTLEVDSPSAISGSGSGSECNALPLGGVTAEDEDLPDITVSVSNSESNIPPVNVMDSQTSNVTQSSSSVNPLQMCSRQDNNARNTIERRNQILQSQCNSSENRGSNAGEDFPSTGWHYDVTFPSVGSSTGRPTTALPSTAVVDDEADSDDSDLEDTDACDKGNEKSGCNRTGGSSSSAMRATSSRDSNIILSNTEHLCRLLNVTMESIMGSANASGTSSHDNNGATVSALAAADTTTLAQCEDLLRDSDECDDAREIVRLSNPFNLNSAVVHNTLNTIRQNEDLSDNEHRTAIVLGTDSGTVPNHSLPNTTDTQNVSGLQSLFNGLLQRTPPRTSAASSEDTALNSTSAICNVRPQLLNRAGITNNGSSGLNTGFGTANTVGEGLAGTCFPGLEALSSVDNITSAFDAVFSSCNPRTSASENSLLQNISCLSTSPGTSLVTSSNMSPRSRDRVNRGRAGLSEGRARGGGVGASRRSSSGGRRSSASNNASPYR